MNVKSSTTAGFVVNSFARITIISGGQTGADRAALDFAIENGMAHAGWCPRGRLAEDGPLATRYQLQETPSRRYAQRTEWNARDSEATVIFTLRPQLAGGTALTLASAKRLGKPTLHLHPHASGDEPIRAAASKLLRFLAEHRVERLNMAGPRASQEPEVGAFVRQVLARTFEMAEDLPPGAEIA